MDVTDPTAVPDLLWRVGCPNLTNDMGCTTGFANMGQTWSTPVGGYAKGYVDGSNNPKLIVAFGGGFDDCLNADVAAYPAACSSAKGKGVYIVDAQTGALLKYLATDAPVISDLAPLDVNFDDRVDFFYVADVAGDLYRVNFATMTAVNPAALASGFNFTTLTKDNWTIVKIGSVADNERRFLQCDPLLFPFRAGSLSPWVPVIASDHWRSTTPTSRMCRIGSMHFSTSLTRPLCANADPDDLEVNEATTVDLDGDTMLAVVDDDDAGSFSQRV